MKSSQHALKTVQRSAIAPALMSFPDAQAYLGNVSRSTLKVLRGRGDVIAINLNRRVAFTRESLDESREAPTARQEVVRCAHRAPARVLGVGGCCARVVSHDAACRLVLAIMVGR
jgi:hypothetical protein